MQRRDFLQTLASLTSGFLLSQPASALGLSQEDWLTPNFTKADFGNDFLWGVATAAYQIEGAWNADGKGESIWDRFTHKRKKKIKTRENGDVACDFYHSYKTDLELLKQLNMNVFRFSTAWSRILPQGIGQVNQKGIDFYHRVIDQCLELGIQPWLTLYHWDLPQALEDKGGWVNRDVINWFAEYTDTVTRAYGDKVKNWMVLNEPAAYTMLGYLIGWHAPGHLAPKKFLAAAHHTTMVMGEAGRIIRKNVQNANIGTTFSCSSVFPKKQTEKHIQAAKRMDIMLNRLYVEPVLGMGYPKGFPFIERIEKHVQQGDMEKIKFDFDFIGLQNYTQVIARNAFIPYLWANQVKPHKRGIAPENINEMGWEVYPEGIYKIIKQFAAYPNCPKIIITENGAAFPDNVSLINEVNDSRRVQFFKDYLGYVLKAKQEGVKLGGYFVWTLMDNFEWAEGYRPRFGLIHIDFKTQKRIIKDSGLWFKEFLK